MFDLDIAVARLCKEQHGVITDDDLERLGGDRFAGYRRTTSGLLVPRHEGVYRHAACPPTPDFELLAAIRAVPSLAAASGPSAMRLYDIRGEWTARPEVTFVGTTHVELDGVHLRRIDHLDAGDIHRRHGIPVLAPPLALLLLGASVPPWKVETAVHDMVFQRFTTLARLIDILIRYGRRGRRGTAAFRRAMRTLDPQGRATQTNFELRILPLLLELGLPEPLLQYWVVDGNGDKRRLDFAWPDFMFDLETDGDRDHLSPAARRADARRDAALRAVGWDIERVTSADVELRGDELFRSLVSRLR